MHFTYCISVEPYDVTATAIFDHLEGEAQGHFMKDLDHAKRIEELSKYIQRVSKWTNWNEEIKGVQLAGLTNAAYLIQFIESRHILDNITMLEKTFSEQLQHLQNDVTERGLVNFSLANISIIQDLESLSLEDFEDIMDPVWKMYPYRDDGHLRRGGLASERYSFCQWSQEWSINSSSVECVVAR